MFFWSLFVGLVMALVLWCEFYALRTGVPTVTSFPSVRRKMIALLREEAAKRSNEKTGRPFTIIDLGSGTGKLTLETGRALPQAQIVGIELSIVPFYISRLRRAFWRVKNVAYRREDFWTCDLSAIDAVTIYMNGKIRARMAEKLIELPTGALIISNETHLPGWTPVEIFSVGLFKVKVVVYRR